MSRSTPRSCQNRVASTQITFSKITSHVPNRLTKTFELKGGELNKESAGGLIKGEASVVTVADLEELTKEFRGLSKNQAIIAGVTGYKHVNIVPYREWCCLGEPTDPIYRGKATFNYPEGSGLLILDYDPVPGVPTFGKDELIKIVKSVLGNVSMVWCPSASSHIVNSETEEDMTGLRGQRLYVFVSCGEDIPSVGQLLNERAWAEGYGACKVNKAGQILECSLFDRMMLQAFQMDFAAGADCVPPLEPRRGDPQIVQGDVEILDTSSLNFELSTEAKERADKHKLAARESVGLEAEFKRKKWVEERAKSILPDNPTDHDIDNVTESIKQALDGGFLNGSMSLLVERDNGKFESVTVEQILDNPHRFHGRQTKDPIEPDYDGGRTVGIIYTNRGTSVVHSFAHCSTVYKLRRERKLIQIFAGRLSEATRTTLQLLVDLSDVFVFGEKLVRVEDDAIYPLDEHALSFYLGGVVQYWKSTKDRPRLIDPPPSLLKSVLSVARQSKLKRLTVLITAPTLLESGRVFDTPGFDEKSGLFLHLNGPSVPIPKNPTMDEIAVCVDALIHPFREFPLEGPKDWGVLLAAILTAVIRPGLPTAPGFGMDAPAQGSGKTLLGRTLGALATGVRPDCWPHTDDRTGEESRKRVFAALLKGALVIIIDNVVGEYKHASVAAALTTDIVSDRILQKSESASVPNRALFILTGNNLTLTGDMVRRILKIRIDPKMEQAFAREFDFDPMEYVLENRQRLTAAALTIIRGYQLSGAASQGGQMASFEVWDKYVRQPVAWISREIRPGKFRDPIEVITCTQDPEQAVLGLLLETWWEIYGSEQITAKEIVESFKTNDFDSGENEKTGILRDAIQELGDWDVAYSCQRLGQLLRRLKGRVAGGLRLERFEDTKQHVAIWRVVEV